MPMSRKSIHGVPSKPSAPPLGIDIAASKPSPTGEPLWNDSDRGANNEAACEFRTAPSTPNRRYHGAVNARSSTTMRRLTGQAVRQRATVHGASSRMRPGEQRNVGNTHLESTDQGHPRRRWSGVSIHGIEDRGAKEPDNELKTEPEEPRSQSHMPERVWTTLQSFGTRTPNR